jgi:multidrug transporter EmrE-like cation transporter
VPADLAQHTLVLDYNDAQGLTDAFARHGKTIACVIVEPVAGNMNLIAPKPEFLAAMRELCTQHGAVLIFDEVMTGFRVGPGSAQGLYGITPDLSTFGKVVGGGMPLGAFGGRREIMEKIAPLGPVYQAGTLSGNPLSVAAGLVTLKKIAAPGFYEALDGEDQALVDGLAGSGEEARRDVQRAVGGRHVRRVFRRHAADLLCRSDGQRQGSLQPLLPCHARCRRLSGALGFRGRLRLGRAQRCRHRRDRGGGRRDLRRRLSRAPLRVGAGFACVPGSRFAGRMASHAGTESRRRLAGLLVAGLCEIAWAIGLKYTEGFTRLVPSAWTLAAMAASVILLAWSLKTLPVGTAYAVWTGVGAVGTALLGMVLFNESREVARLVCIGLIVAGILGLKLVTK